MPEPEMVAALAALVAAGKPAVDAACRSFETLTGKPFEVAGSMLTDALYRRKVNHQLVFLAGVLPRLRALGVDPKPLAAEFGLPLLDAVGSVENPELRELWENLTLSGATDPECQRPVFVHRLRDLSPQDVRAFRAACEAADRFGLTGPLPVDMKPAYSVTPHNAEETCLKALDLIEWFHPKDIKEWVAIPSGLGWMLRAAVLRA